MSWGRDSQKQKEGKRGAFTTESHLKNYSLVRKKTCRLNKCGSAEQRMPGDASSRAYLPLKRSGHSGGCGIKPSRICGTSLKLLLFKFYVIAVAIFSKDHYLIFLRAQGGSQMDRFAAVADIGVSAGNDFEGPYPVFTEQFVRESAFELRSGLLPVMGN
jgi:hypothetical protein